jgi:hypothetical protein
VAKQHLNCSHASVCCRKSKYPLTRNGNG